MSRPVISVENLSKAYRIGLREAIPDTFVGALAGWMKAPLKNFWRLRSLDVRQAVKSESRLRSRAVRRTQNPDAADPTANGCLPTVPDAPQPAAPQDIIWALKDVSFEVQKGEVLGIIGRNGAGKSTLLKILSRITEPTSGRAVIRGRVSSLLEVGTGFHPELTGRENIYMNGTILGMTRREIDRKFDEIVDFSGVETFLDTPIKRYSSGMKVRLAFAVAAHLDPEILIVDEVLAVGDAEFQKKCLGKMQAVAGSGRTVLFVSHQMNSIRRLCERCIWLDMGSVQLLDPVAEVVAAYETTVLSTRANGERVSKNSFLARFLRWEIIEPQCKQSNWLTTLKTITFKTVLQLNKSIRNSTHGIALRNSDNQLVWAWAAYNLHLEPGTIEFVYTLPSLPIRPGVYYFHVSLYEDAMLLDEWGCIPELVVATEPLTHPKDEWSGVLNIPCSFEVIN